jgi:2-haloacid dehalogenase
MSMPDVRALLFDTFGTLVDWRSGLVAQLQTWGSVHDFAVDWPRLVDAWRRDSVPALAEVRTGQREWANLDELQRETMARLAPQFGLPALSHDALDQLVQMWHELPAWPDTVEGMARLRSRYLVAPLSNGHVALLMRLARAAGITFDAIFGADVFRQYKPDPQTYLGAANLLVCAPGEVMLVASHPIGPCGGGGKRAAHLFRLPAPGIRRRCSGGAAARRRRRRFGGWRSVGVSDPPGVQAMTEIRGARVLVLRRT